MKPNTCPNPPANLLKRCIDTIPPNASRRMGRLHVALEAPSRNRLRWLSVAAAVPVVGVLAIVPVRHYLQARERSKEIRIAEYSARIPAGAERIHRYLVFSDFRPVNSNPARENWFAADRHRTDMWDVLRGHYSDAYINGHQGAAATQFHDATLETVGGAVYQRSGNNLHIIKRNGNAFAAEYWARIGELFDPKAMTALISGYGSAVVHSDGTREELPVVVGKSARGTWSGAIHPVQADWQMCFQHPSREMKQAGAPTVKVSFVRDVHTGRLLGYTASAYWRDPWSVRDGTAQRYAPIIFAKAEYEYGSEDDARPYGGPLTERAFLKGAAMISNDGVTSK